MEKWERERLSIPRWNVHSLFPHPNTVLLGERVSEQPPELGRSSPAPIPIRSHRGRTHFYSDGVPATRTLHSI